MLAAVFVVTCGDFEPAGTVAPWKTVSSDVWLVVCGGALECVTSVPLVVCGGALGCVTVVPLVVCGEVEGGGEDDDALSGVTPVVIWCADVGGVLLVVATQADRLPFFVVRSELVVCAAVGFSAVTCSAAEEAEKQTA